MNEKIRSQILAIRDSGRVNMFSVNEVQRLAFERDFHELVLFIEERKADYVHFIMTGEMPKQPDCILDGWLDFLPRA